MAKSKINTLKLKSQEADSWYILKIIFYLIIGSLWLRFIPHTGRLQVPFPLGAVVGVLFASHEKFQIDRKIEYSILIVAMFVGFWLPIGFEVDI